MDQQEAPQEWTFKIVIPGRFYTSTEYPHTVLAMDHNEAYTKAKEIRDSYMYYGTIVDMERKEV